MKPIKKIRKNKSSLTNCQESSIKDNKPWNLLDLQPTFLLNDSNDKVLATERFQAVPFRLFVQNANMKPLRTEQITVEPTDYNDGNMTERFVSRQTNAPQIPLGKIQTCNNMYTLFEEDEDDLY